MFFSSFLINHTIAIVLTSILIQSITQEVEFKPKIVDLTIITTTPFSSTLKKLCSLYKL